jgi:PilZ domain
MTITPRAERLLLAIPISYRRTGDHLWFQSRVVNISQTGVLFEPAYLPLGTPIEVIVSPPIDVGSLASGKHVCVGEVVRTTDGGGAAARFVECRFHVE